MDTQNQVYIGPDNGLLPDGTKPLPKSILLFISEFFWNSPEGNFTGKVQNPCNDYVKYAHNVVLLSFGLVIL